MSDGGKGRKAGSAERASGDGELPAVDFATFLLSLGHSTLVHLGVARDSSEDPSPGGGPSGTMHPVDLPMARQTIDLIVMLGEKTKGNLTGEEERMLEHLIYDLQVRYVEVLKATRSAL